jgi:hypothetical protein
VPPIFTEPGYNLHTADEIGIDSFQADRGPPRWTVQIPQFLDGSNAAFSDGSRDR